MRVQDKTTADKRKEEEMRERLKDIIYSRLLGSKKWKSIRMQYLRTHPLCERCLEEGRTTLAQQVHHVIPVTQGKDAADKRRLAYSDYNLRALCEECHRRTHEEMGTWRTLTREQRKSKAQCEAEGFLKAWVTDGRDDSRG